MLADSVELAIQLGSGASGAPSDFHQLGDWLYFRTGDYFEPQGWAMDDGPGGPKPVDLPSELDAIVEFDNALYAAGNSVYRLHDGGSELLSEREVEAMAVWRGELYFTSQGQLWRTASDPDLATPLGYLPPLLLDDDFFDRPRLIAGGGDTLFLHGRSSESAQKSLWSWRPETGFDLAAPGFASIDEVVTTSSGMAFRAGPYHAQQLWGTRGSEATASVLLTFESSEYEPLIALESRFVVATGTGSRELWASDGTATGTTKLATFERMELTSSVVIDGTAYFMADDGANGRELWQTNGSAAGTRLVADLAPGAASSDYAPAFAFGRGVVLTRYEGVATRLWLYDLVTQGVTLFHDGPTVVTGYQNSTADFAGRAWYAASDQIGAALWSSDGTSWGTRRAANLDPHNGERPADIAVQGGRLFIATNGFYDGSSSFGRLLRVDDARGAVNELERMQGMSQLAPIGNRMVFANGGGIWGTDGTMRAAEFLAIGDLGLAEVWGNQLLLLSRDHDLVATDGTAAGTKILARDVNAAPIVSGDRVYFERAQSIYFTRGVPGDEQLYQATSGTGAEIVGALGQQVFYWTREAANSYRTLWRTDGTSSGAYALPLSVFTGGRRGVVYRDQLLVQGDGELWSTDGSVANTRRLAQSVTYAFVSGFAELSAGLVFLSDGNEIWRTDGTAAGTRMVATLAAPSSSLYSNLPVPFEVVFGDAAYFIAGDGQIYRTDGQASEVERVTNFDSETKATGLAAFEGSVYFGYSNPRENWLGRYTPSYGSPTLRNDPVTLVSSQGRAYRVPTGTAEQIRTVPLRDVAEVRLTFDDPVVVAQGDLTILGASGRAYATGAFTYDVDSRTGIWTLAEPITEFEQLTLHLRDNVRDLNGAPLDGEWFNPRSLQDTRVSRISGDRHAGGDFRFVVNLLPGDANRDNAVTGDDYSLWSDHFGRLDGRWPTADFNIDGQVSGADFAIWADNFGAHFESPKSGATGEESPDPARGARRDLDAQAVDDALSVLAPSAPRVENRPREAAALVVRTAPQAGIERAPMVVTKAPSALTSIVGARRPWRSSPLRPHWEIDAAFSG